MNAKTIFYLLKRVLLSLFSIFIVVTLTFFVMRAIPGGPFVGEKATTPAAQAVLEAKYGLDKPLSTQYFTYFETIFIKLIR